MPNPDAIVLQMPLEVAQRLSTSPYNLRVTPNKWVLHTCLQAAVPFKILAILHKGSSSTD
jgi:hypothetical protein